MYCKRHLKKYRFNQFLAYIPTSYPLKTPENVWFSGVFRGYKTGTFARNELQISINLANILNIGF